MIRWIRSEVKAGEIWSDLAWLAVVAAGIAGWIAACIGAQ